MLPTPPRARKHIRGIYNDTGRHAPAKTSVAAVPAPGRFRVAQSANAKEGTNEGANKTWDFTSSSATCLTALLSTNQNQRTRAGVNHKSGRACEREVADECARTKRCRQAREWDDVDKRGKRDGANWRAQWGGARTNENANGETLELNSKKSRPTDTEPWVTSNLPFVE
ncbi:hypothetical protein BC826DRAFT_972682 [Russula brevipes]|nr:hypothetical protein BC826DRAFT_972682 [Russula brevipes]